MKALLTLFGLLGSVSAFACDTEVSPGGRVNFGYVAGTVVEVLGNDLKIAVDGYDGFHYRSVNEVGTACECLKGLGVNGRVKFDGAFFGHFVGTALEVFSNGNVKIAVDGYSSFTYLTINQLQYSATCHN
jgi:hypothetical protein